MSENMKIYELCRSVPAEAQKMIGAGKLKGFTDITPMWRIQKLTEIFGSCGVGWYTQINKLWTEQGTDGRVAQFCEIHLFVKENGEWSAPIVGVGGSMLVNIFKGSPETSDEAVKMAYTDAISVACKALGMGADVYWGAGRQTKYDTAPAEPTFCTRCGQQLKSEIKTTNKTYTAAEYFEKFGGLCPVCATADYAAKRNAGGGK